MISFFVVAIGIQHLLFMILEMIFWEKPLGLKIFKNTLDKARLTAVLAKNQGIYNGCFGGGLLWSLLLEAPTSVAVQQYLFMSILVCGITGGLTFSTRILWIQALPAGIGLGLLY